MLRLLAGREAAIEALTSALIDPARQAEHPAIRTALVQFGRDAPAPLVALLRSGQTLAQIEACRALAELGQSPTALDLLAPALLDDSPEELQSAAKDALLAVIGRVPERDEALSALLVKAKSGFAAALEEPDLEASAVPQWRWNEMKGALEYLASSPLAGQLDRAADLAADARKLVPRRREAVWLSLAARIEAEAYRAGIDQPAPTGAGTGAALLEMEEVDVLDGLVGYALAEGHTVAAIAAVRALGQQAKRDVLYRWQPQPSSLVAAAQSGDRRLRYAALAAIMGLKPKEPYPGSSQAVEALGYLAGSFAAPRAIVADARSGEVERQAGLLAALGYETDAATDDRDVVALAIGSPDYVLALIDYTLAGPTSGQLLQRLRRDSRTARLPIGIIASTDDLDAARRLAARTPLCAIIYRPVDEAGLEFQVDRLLATAGKRLVSAEERRQQAQQALDWLVEIATIEQGIYNLRWTNNLRRVEPSLLVALEVPEFSPSAARVLAALGTAFSQRSLANLASQLDRPEEMRQSAAKAFADSVARFGTLLTTGEIDLQYTRYNQSERQDAQTQAILASILDAMEARAAADQAGNQPSVGK
jgi:CheY-like chemotaxis protein